MRGHPYALRMLVRPLNFCRISLNCAWVLATSQPDAELIRANTQMVATGQICMSGQLDTECKLTMKQHTSLAVSQMLQCSLPCCPLQGCCCQAWPSTWQLLHSDWFQSPSPLLPPCFPPLSSCQPQLWTAGSSGCCPLEGGHPSQIQRCHYIWLKSFRHLQMMPCLRQILSEGACYWQHLV